MLFYLNDEMIFMFSNIARVSVGPFGRLFVVGNSGLLDSALASSRFAVAGSRRGVSSDSVSWLQSQIRCLDPAHHVLVSGLALGIDSAAHRAALDCGIPQIVVMPCGLDYITPASNTDLLHDIVAAGGCVVSAYAPHIRPHTRGFIDRNQIIAWLGHMLIVPQFEVRSGTRHTVDNARALGKFIIVPNLPFSGNQFIIGNGAYRTIVK